jgi:hypothetical protein
MKSFKPHDTKQVIRDQWCRKIVESTGTNLTYLGLPAREALDVLNWLPHLDKVIAFQCNDHREDKLITWEDAAYLETKLLTIERKSDISSYSLYKGYIETVILRGRDEDGKPFDATKPVNVFNMDFCNDLTSPLKTFDQNNNPIKYYKLEAIAKLLEQQRDLPIADVQKGFTMFVTVHANINELDLLVHKNDISSGEYADYYNRIMTLTGIEKKIRLVKLSMFHFLKTYFCSRFFVPHFLPPVFYQGTGGHKLLTFTIKGTYEKTSIGSSTFKQDMQALLNSKFVFADGSGLSLYTHASIQENDISLDPLA